MRNINKRKSGILFPIFSIPSKYGIGTFSKEAYAFVDFLEQAGQKLWQILPIGPTGYGDSPYQPFSTFAGNPYFIDLEDLVKRGYIEKEECDACDFGTDTGYIDYEKIYLSRFKMLFSAYETAFFKKNLGQEAEYLRFIRENRHWLEDYALYMAIKNSFDNICWIEWEEGIRLRKPESMKVYREKFQKEVAFYKFQQYIFSVQWKALKNYANNKGIEIIGDIPIYVAFDSADVWANPLLFQVDENGEPNAVAGCPPDAFSKSGQLWGNPLYDWEYHKETNYEWWLNRIAYCFELYDVLRIDHFRGFDEFWSVPYGDETAENGAWIKGPGYDIFKRLKERLGNKKVIAEDLGFLTDSVWELVEKTGYPGMKILQFAFDSREESDYLPHNYSSNCVVYTGTHDNNTILGWYTSLDKNDRDMADRYLNLYGHEHEVEWEFIRAALASVADTAIIPIQDYLGLDESARINIPSTVGTNWKWRLDPKQLNEKLSARMKKMTKLYGRQ